MNIESLNISLKEEENQARSGRNRKGQSPEPIDAEEVQMVSILDNEPEVDMDISKLLTDTCVLLAQSNAIEFETKRKQLIEKFDKKISQTGNLMDLEFTGYKIFLPFSYDQYQE